MKKLNYLWALAAFFVVGACSNDTLQPDVVGSGIVSPEDGVYMTVNFDMPTVGGTRSFTNGDNSSNSGVEIGSASENAVGDVAIVLTKKDYSYIASAEVARDKISPVGTSGRSYKTTSTFSKTTIAQYYASPDFDREICVFVFCNPTSTLKDILKNAQLGNATWFNEKAVYDVVDEKKEVIWAENAFLMGNSAIAPRFLPATVSDWDNYATEISPFNLSGMNMLGRPNEVDNYTNKGNVIVERAAARFDFRDGSVDGINNEDKTYNGIGGQTYKVVLDSEEAALVNVKLGKMSLVNMDKSFYFLKRVSSNGLDANSILCGPELPWYTSPTGTPILDSDNKPVNGNYVVDASAEWKNVKELPNAGYAAHFNYPFFDENGVIDNIDNSNDRWFTSVISNVLSDEAKDDNPNDWNPSTGENKHQYPGYKVWRYATENTIPADDAHQKNGISTGIVFKGQLLAARTIDEENDDQATKDLINALQINSDVNAGNPMTDPILYLFAGHVYCNWTNIRNMALELAISDLKWEGDAETGNWTYTITRSGALYNAVFGTGGFGNLTFTYHEKDKDGNIVATKTADLEDPLAPDPNCANTKYNEWKKDNASINDTELFDKFRNAVVAANITVYQRSYDKDLGGWGYYCYYYYWNRHNNNGQNGVMGPMEFAVVRNNVYKLAVTKIARLGHPRISANDPDKPTPNTPDEKSEVYITVTCTTLPWVVRLNEIEF